MEESPAKMWMSFEVPVKAFTITLWASSTKTPSGFMPFFKRGCRAVSAQRIKKSFAMDCFALRTRNDEITSCVLSPAPKTIRGFSTVAKNHLWALKLQDNEGFQKGF